MKNKKILIVEDDANFSEIMKMGFLGSGIDVVFARNGQEGIDVVQKEKPDLILMDILMPKIDGIEAAKNIKAAGVNSPIIFLTNVKDIDSMGKALEVSQSDYIVKADMHVSQIVDRVKEKLGVK